MPLYDYHCPACGHIETKFQRIAELDVVTFEHCRGVKMERLISAPMVAPDYEPYSCPITGRLISGRREHIENLKRHGCRLKEPGETEEYMKKVQSGYFKKQQEKEIEKIVDEAIRDTGFNT